ncbi:MAG TPA: hypothetical protein EYN06_06140 [Myxococcales bacterium]|nr:hypothetical protein [Myxococcales bacterium]HIN86043.1 hypothetical protein [Myxococcales bacterium]
MNEQNKIENAADMRGSLERHPNDGWVMADPYPLNKNSVRALHGVIRAICPLEPNLPDLEGRMETHVRRSMRYMHPILALGLLIAIRLLDWAPFWRFKGITRLHKMDRLDASELLASLAHSRLTVLRTLLMGVRAIVNTGFYDQDEIHEHLDYHPQEWMRNRIELRDRLLSGGSTTDADNIGPYSHIRID